MNMKKTLALILCALMITGMLTACGQAGSQAESTVSESTASEASTPASSGTEEKSSEAAADSGEEGAEEEEEVLPPEGLYFKYGLATNADSSGLMATFTTAYWPLSVIFERLIVFDVDAYEYQGQLAESWDTSSDGLTWTVKLKQDHKWHDGEPVTADDVVYTFTASILGGNYRTSKLSSLEGYGDAQEGKSDNVSGIKKIDDYTVEFKLEAPNSLFIDSLANNAFCILPEHLLKDTAPVEIPNSSFWSNPVGSGMYKVEEMRLPDYVILTANTEYEKQPGCEKILLRNAGDEGPVTGEIYMGYNLDEEAKEVYESQTDEITFYQPASTYHRYLSFNISERMGTNGTPHPSTKSARVRKALEMLIDKESIAILFGTAIPLTTEINPNLPEYNSDLPEFKRDVEGAKAILDEEGFDYSTPLYLNTSYTNQITTDMFELIKQNFAEAGVQLEYKQDDNWEPNLRENDFDLYYMGYMSKNVIDFYSDICALSRGTYNDFLSHDEETQQYYISIYDEPVAEYLATTDPVKQKEILDKLQYNAYMDTINIPLYATATYTWINTAHVSGFPIYARDYEEIVDVKPENWIVQ